MPSPFPGMDPYLEHPEQWPSVHLGLIVAIRDALVPRVRPKYRVVIETRTFFDLPGDLKFTTIPDVGVLREARAPYGDPIQVAVPMVEEMRQGYLKIRNVATGEVITVIEIFSPTNKRPGKGRAEYEDKRLQILSSRVNLVEIDLLRDGEPLQIFGNGHHTAYRILASRARRRPDADLYAFGIREPISAFPLPLARGDDEPPVDLQTLLHDLYDRAGYDLAINYRGDATPPLQGDDASWADALLRAKNLR